MDQAKLTTAIEWAAREEVPGLNLSGEGITELPEQIGQLTSLKELDLSENHLTELPAQIGRLTRLRVLELRGNQLTALPEQVGELADLRALGLSRNQLVTLPKRFVRLESLQKLYLNENRLASLPPLIGQLTNLWELYLHGNKLTRLPEQIGRLLNLRKLCLDGNQLGQLPKSIGNLAKLKYLDLGDADADRGNPLVELPDEFRNLRQLEYLDVSNCPELNLPPEIVDRRDAPQEILRYYFESRGDKGRPLRELKLLLVGRGKAGKTTLVKQLAGEEPDENEQETHSIAIRELTLGCAKGKVRTRAWDFGGQEILHSTHQFFLTERSLYLLVLEPRTGSAQRDAEYWLKLIETQGGGSPVILVMNWSHGRRWQVDEVKLRRKFPFIVDFLSTDALLGEGVEELCCAIIQTVEERMPDVWRPFPQRWREIKDAVAGMKDNFLTYEQYAQLCDRNGEKDPDAQSDLAGILHSLGLALYFGKDPQLHDKRVLNPGWVTGGVYAVIRAPSVAESDGQLAVTDMPQVLREAELQNVVKAAEYPADTHEFILELMRAFQLCFASEEERDKPVRYLVPELLPEFEPEMEEPWEEAPVRLRYRYEVLPPGLLPRFIVRTHTLSDSAPHWRHGVVLRHGDASALIRAESDRRELHVFVLGGDEEMRRLMAAMVRSELETLHSEMKMHAVEELELTGEGEKWISVKALREVEEPQRPRQKLPVQPDGTAEVNVSSELDKLVPAEARAIDRDPSKKPAPVRVFVSYAHDDERQLKRLDLLLAILEEQHGLAPWRDKRLIAGENWDHEIRRRLEEMDIFLFIASQTSLVRPYIKDPELRRAKERHEAGEIEIVTVKLEPCACDEDPFLGKLQRLAARHSSIAETNLRSTAWEQVRKDFLPVIQRVRRRRRGDRG